MTPYDLAKGRITYRSNDRPTQTRPRVRLAAPARAAQSGRHRAGHAAARRRRRDSDKGRTAARLRQPAGARQGRGRADDRPARGESARRLHRRRRHRGGGRPPHPAQGRTARRGRAMPAPALGPQPPRLYRALHGHAEGGFPPAAGRDPRALQAALARRTSKRISRPANGAARPAAMRCRGLPAPSS